MAERKIPDHVAIIMDGNGRWARKRGLPRTAGHAKGAQVVEQILQDASDIGIRYLTVYAFSTENWSRPASEVNTLMNLFRTYLKSSMGKCMKNNVRMRIIGDRTKLSPELTALIENAEKTTENNTGITFTLAINYGSRDEMRRAVTDIAKEVKEGRLAPEDITEETISSHLDTADLPDPDLLIRTCGEQRLSNYLMWQLSYTELYFTDVAWPDFTKEDLLKAVEAYQHRERRFGGLIS